MSGGVKKEISTNAQKGSVCKVDVPPVTFDALWAAYPTGKPYVDPKSGKPPPGYANQCAIKVSVALHGVGVEMRSFTGSSIKLNGKTTAVGATELANWLKKQPFCGLSPKAEAVTGRDWQTKLKARQGIVYFSNYWQRQGEAGNQRSGDHIDLWSGTRLTTSGLSPGTLATMGRYLGLREFLPGTDVGYSDLAGSDEILFWEIR